MTWVLFSIGAFLVYTTISKPPHSYGITLLISGMALMAVAVVCEVWSNRRD